MDPGWRFYVGSQQDANEAVTLDVGLSIDPANRYGAYAKAGGVPGPASPSFEDRAWRLVNLPHDWAVELPFNEKAYVGLGSKAIGPRFPASSVAWYRRTFSIPGKDEGRRISIEFDGVFRDCEVFINGHYLTRNFSGYAPFSADLSPYLNYGGGNVIAVRVNAISSEGWFYEGAGIYRHVWLVKAGPVHIPKWGTHLASTVAGDPENPEGATLVARTTVQNDSDAPATVTVPVRVLDPSGASVASGDSASVTLAPWSSAEVETAIKISSPHLWSVDDPYLYQVETGIKGASGALDLMTTPFGIRTIRFDPDQGFFLNGKRVFLKGTCNHQDHAGVGSALPDRVNVWRIEQLKSMGCNAYRSSPNHPTPEILDACDRLGMLVMDENRMVGASEEALSQLERLIRRDRNHPSVVIWNLGNEEMIQGGKDGILILTPMQRLAKRLDPTRPTTVAMNGSWGSGFSTVVDVQGGNYLKLGGFDTFHKNFPEQPVLGSEEACAPTTRGIYVKHRDLNEFYCYANESKNGYGGWESSAEEWMNHYAKRPFLAGAFVWTGFDYRGEPLPYNAWPSISSNSGILDTCGFPKDIYYFYQAWWTDKPVLHLLPHWNWPDLVGKPIDVRCDGNANEVELFVNGASQGRKPMSRLGHLDWTVTYQPGTLSAKGYSGGRQVSEVKVETTGVPAAVRLSPDRTTLGADGEDVSMISVAVVDAKGRVVPTANIPISFTLDGSGRILGVGNGDPICHEPDQLFLPAPAVIKPENWISQVIAGEIDQAVAPRVNESGWAKDLLDGKTLKAKGQVGVWRTEVTITAEQVDGRAVSMIDGKANGKLTWYWDGKALPNASGNSVIPLPEATASKHILAAVVTATAEKEGGLQEASQIVIESRKALSWKRSTFNGLAQVLVQSFRAIGSVRLKATAPDMAAGETVLKIAPANSRSLVP